MTRKQLKNENEEEKIDVNIENNPLEDFDDDDIVATILKEIGEDTGGETYEMKVYRVPHKGGRLSWLFDCDPTLSVLARLRDEYQGGEFELRVIRGNRIFKRKRVAIEAPKVAQIYKKPESELSGENLLNVLEKQQENFLKSVSEIFNAVKPAVQESPIKQMAEMMALLDKMKTYNNAGQPPPAQQLSLMDQLKDVLEVQKLLSSGKPESGETSNGDIILSLLENIGKPFTEHLAKNAPAQQLPGPAIDKINQDKKAKGESVNMIKIGINVLLAAAKKDSDPAIYVDLILDRFDENQIKQYLTNPAAMENIIKMQPDIANYQNWFTELLSLVKAQVETPATLKAENSHNGNDKPVK